MANSKYDYHNAKELATESRFNEDTYLIVRIDGEKFHKFCPEHNFHKPNDKRGLDLMVEAAKCLMREFKGHIPLAYGHSDEFSFMIRSTSNLLSRRIQKLTSVLTSVFGAHYNDNFDKFFLYRQKHSARFDARIKEYANCKTVIEYFRWRQVDCHVNNLYNTTLHALTGRYRRHELIPCDNMDSSDRKLFENGSGDGKLYELRITPITEWIPDKSKFFSSKDATDKLSGTVSSQKQDIMFLDYKINYNNELEQFKKGTVVVDTNNDNLDSIKHFNLDLINDYSFWIKHQHIFNDSALIQQ